MRQWVMSKAAQRKEAAFRAGYAAYKVDKDSDWKPYVNQWVLTPIGKEYKRGYDLAKDEMQTNNTLINRLRVLFGMANV